MKLTEQVSISMKLNQIELEYVKGQVRQDLRRQDKKKLSLLRKFGDLADLSIV